MAWENVPVTIFNIPQSTINDFAIINNTQGDVGRFISFSGRSPQSCGLQTNVYVWGNSSGLSLYTKSGYDTITFIGRNNGADDTSIFGSGESDLTSNDRYYTFVCAIDESSQLGFLGFIRTWNSGGTPTSYYFFPGTYPYATNKCYQLIKSQMQPPYNWTSVPSISGKNGILFLSTIQSVYLNNGDPVNNAPANYIQFADDSNVAILVGEQIDDPTLVTIQYIVPTGTYEYIKLVYKVDSAPTSITDGTAVDILQANRSVTISGIANGNTYFFKIFTDVSESEPYEFTTTKPPIASNYVFELDLSTDGKDIVRYDATKDIGNHKQGELYGSGISIEDGILTTSSWIYWDYDGTENPKFIPANCTLTFEYDAFFPNGEGYLDWYVIDSNGNERIYWCFDTQHAFQSNKWYNCKTVAKVQNGKIVRYKYVLDGNEISSNTADINMPCVNTESSLGISQIYFRLTRTTKFKNMSIYFDFSEYHDGGGSGSGSSGRA